MKIYLELLVLVFIPMIIFILWYLWNAWSRKRLLKKYNPEKDKGKLAEDKRKEEGNHDGKNKREGGEQCFGRPRETERELGKRIKDSIRSEQLEGRQQLPIPDVNNDGQISSSNRKNGKSIRGLLGRRRRRN